MSSCDDREYKYPNAFGGALLCVYRQISLLEPFGISRRLVREVLVRPLCIDPAEVCRYNQKDMIN
jgi:hypothetical protein